jgi:hypothetical protein
LLEAALREFHARDWREDVNLLNRQLARANAPNAGLQESPPSILTGDPFELKPNACILIIGINPSWPSSAKQQAVDVRPAEVFWGRGFDAYRSHRRTYFEEAAGPHGKTRNRDHRYNGRHFSKLGNFIAHALRVSERSWDAGPNARHLFRTRAAVFDLLPYWSKDAKQFDLSRIDASRQHCVRDWYNVINAFIAQKRPKAIIVNNCGQRHLIETVLKCQLAPVRDTPFYAGRRAEGEAHIPILAQPFLSNWRGSRQAYVEGFDRWAKVCSAQLPLL